MPVIGVVVADIREGRLVAAVACRLVDAVDNLLERLTDSVHDGAVRHGGSLLTGPQMVVRAEILRAVIVEDIEELTECYCTLALC